MKKIIYTNYFTDSIIFTNKKYFLPNIFTFVILLNLMLIPIPASKALTFWFYAPFFYYFGFKALNRAHKLELSVWVTIKICILFPFIVSLFYIFGIIIINGITGFYAFTFFNN